MKGRLLDGETENRYMRESERLLHGLWMGWMDFGEGGPSQSNFGRDSG